jgi:hypothetical protein
VKLPQYLGDSVRKEALSSFEFLIEPQPPKLEFVDHISVLQTLSIQNSFFNVGVIGLMQLFWFGFEFRMHTFGASLDQEEVTGIN